MTPNPDTALAVVDAQPLALSSLAVLEDNFKLAIRQRELLATYISSQLKPGKHFYQRGKDKPSLTKEGAEIILLPHSLAPDYDQIGGPAEPPENDQPYQITVKCTLRQKGNPNSFVGSGIGSAGSHKGCWLYGPPKEWGYQLRQTDKYLCHNATLKMAQKSAMIAATINSTAASEFFTQDMDEEGSHGPGEIDARQAAREAESEKARQAPRLPQDKPGTPPATLSQSAPQGSPSKAPRSQPSLKPAQDDRKGRIAGLKKWLGPKEKAAIEFLRLFLADGSDANCALSAEMSETLDDLQVSDLDTIKGADGKGTQFMALLDDFIAQNKHLVPAGTASATANWSGTGTASAEPQQGSTDAALPKPSVPSERTSNKEGVLNPGAESPPLPDNCPKCQSPRLEYGVNYGHRVGVCGACDHHFLADLALDEAWRKHRLPEKIKKNAGMHLGALAKNDLFGWCMNQKPDPKYPDSQRLRAMLDLAQACYNFTEKGKE